MLAASQSHRRRWIVLPLLGSAALATTALVSTTPANAQPVPRAAVSWVRSCAVPRTAGQMACDALRVTNTTESYDIDATIDGGGISGQAGAMRLGIARSLCEMDPEHRAALKRSGLLTRDAREKESKKYGLKKARKAPQYSKR